MSSETIRCLSNNLSYYLRCSFTVVAEHIVHVYVLLETEIV